MASYLVPHVNTQGLPVRRQRQRVRNFHLEGGGSLLLGKLLRFCVEAMLWTVSVPHPQDGDTCEPHRECVTGHLFLLQTAHFLGAVLCCTVYVEKAFGHILSHTRFSMGVVFLRSREELSVAKTLIYVVSF